MMLIGAAAMLIERARVADAELLSTALTVKLEFPAAVGVPAIWPEAPKLNPAGRAPALIDQV